MLIFGGGITSVVRQCLSIRSLEATEGTAGWPVPASRAMAGSATGEGPLASVGAAAAAWWW